MKVGVIGGGPGGLYSALLIKKSIPSAEIVVHERNQRDDTFGFGVVFSDRTLGNLESADASSFAAIKHRFAYWDRIDTFYKDTMISCGGNGFCGMSRVGLLQILRARATELGITILYNSDVTTDDLADCDLIIAADGIASATRSRFAEHFRPSIQAEANRFVWLGTTFPYEAFTFYFKEDLGGLWRIHAYRYQDKGSTFIAECSPEMFERGGFDEHDEDATVAYLEEVFRDELAGHHLIKNKSVWRRFHTVKNERWSHDNIVLVGDAAHTAHFSIGSGTKLAMEDAISLAQALQKTSDHSPVGIKNALRAYQDKRAGNVDKLQRAARDSLRWFEETESLLPMPPTTFCYSLMTRSLRITDDKLRERDPQFVKGLLNEDGDDALAAPLSTRHNYFRSRIIVDATATDNPDDIIAAFDGLQAQASMVVVKPDMAAVDAWQAFASQLPSGVSLALSVRMDTDPAHCKAIAETIGASWLVGEAHDIPRQTQIETLAACFGAMTLRCAPSVADQLASVADNSVFIWVDCADGSRVPAPAARSAELLKRNKVVTWIGPCARDNGLTCVAAWRADFAVLPLSQLHA